MGTHTPGEWSLKGSTVISTEKPIRSSYRDEDFEYEKEHFGGYIIAESITEADTKLIAAAPKLLDACQSVMNSPRGETLKFEVLNKLYEAIKKATE